jgi:hypothetical protein
MQVTAIPQLAALHRNNHAGPDPSADRRRSAPITSSSRTLTRQERNTRRRWMGRGRLTRSKPCSRSANGGAARTQPVHSSASRAPGGDRRGLFRPRPRRAQRDSRQGKVVADFLVR